MARKVGKYTPFTKRTCRTPAGREARIISQVPSQHRLEVEWLDTGEIEHMHWDDFEHSQPGDYGNLLLREMGPPTAHDMQGERCGFKTVAALLKSKE